MDGEVLWYLPIAPEIENPEDSVAFHEEKLVSFDAIHFGYQSIGYQSLLSGDWYKDLRRFTTASEKKSPADRFWLIRYK